MAAFHKIEEALEDLKKGKIILVTDDAERENEGDFICAAQLINYFAHSNHPPPFVLLFIQF